MSIVCKDKRNIRTDIRNKMGKKKVCIRTRNEAKIFLGLLCCALPTFWHSYVKVTWQPGTRYLYLSIPNRKIMNEPALSTLC